MLKIENVVLPSAEQWEAIIRGMRNPKNSWDRMDSDLYPVADEITEENYKYRCAGCKNEPFRVIGKPPASKPNCMVIGENDHNLMMGLAAGGPVHAKYRRMIPVFLDITAPLYWWKEFDTYKVGTVANSCSTMHKIHAKEFDWDDFSYEHLKEGLAADTMSITIRALNAYRGNYLKSRDKDDWWQMVQLLPTSYNQKRTVMLNYEVLVNIYKWRKNHKLDEWHTFCDWIESLPYSELITGCNKEKEDG